MLYWGVTSHVEELSEGVPLLVEAIPDVAAFRTFTVHFDRRGVWDIHHHHFRLLLVDR